LKKNHYQFPMNYRSCLVLFKENFGLKKPCLMWYHHLMEKPKI